MCLIPPTADGDTLPGDGERGLKLHMAAGAGVLEVVENDAGGTYRAVYTVKYAEAVFVLHCFQK